MQEKNKGVRKSEIHQRVGKIVIIIIIVLLMVYLTYVRSQRLGGIYFNFSYIIVTMGLSAIIYGVIYKFLFMAYIFSIKDIEAEQEYFEELKENLKETEKEVYRVYGRNLDAKMLKYVEKKYKLRYFVTIVEDTIFVFTRDYDEEESPHEPISISDFCKYFEFK